MTDDATLSDFAASGDEESADADDGGGSPGETATPGDVAFSTYAWGSYTCSQCEETTERVWRDDGALVCPECKRW